MRRPVPALTAAAALIAAPMLAPPSPAQPAPSQPGPSRPAPSRPMLVSATPAADAVVAPTDRVRLTFSDKLSPASASAVLEMTGMPGMATHAPMKMKIATAVDPDGTGLIVTTPKPLPKGTYRLTYRVAAAGAQPVEGAYGFEVR